MSAKRKPKLDTVIEGMRVRVYATRSEYEALIGDGDIDDPEAEVLCIPMVGIPNAWAAVHAQTGWRPRNPSNDVLSIIASMHQD